jgi:hypothetical protein
MSFIQLIRHSERNMGDCCAWLATPSSFTATAKLQRCHLNILSQGLSAFLCECPDPWLMSKMAGIAQRTKATGLRTPLHYGLQIPLLRQFFKHCPNQFRTHTQRDGKLGSLNSIPILDQAEQYIQHSRLQTLPNWRPDKPPPQPTVQSPAGV